MTLLALPARSALALAKEKRLGEEDASDVRIVEAEIGVPRYFEMRCFTSCGYTW